MVILVIIWGFDYVPAKLGLEILSPMQLLFFKYGIGFCVMIVIKAAQRNKNLVRVKDIPLFVLCAIFGEVLYFFFEYSAMDYMPVSLITIILAFVPVVSIAVERVVFGRRSNSKIIVGIFILIGGVVLVIGTDYHILFTGRGIGYLLAIGAVFSWNIYNFITSSLEKYDSCTLACTQMICTLLITTPIAWHNMPSPEEFSTTIVLGLLWVGCIDSGLGFLIMVYSLQKLGPTTSALYSNFLPVTSTVFGALFLHQHISALQIFGGIVVIASGFVVIKEKGKLDEERLKC